MKKLKDISKKQWGVVSTSIGSFLIIVGLLAMVGTQSGSTYAVSFEYCSCSGNYKRVGNTCVLQGLSDFNCCTGAGCTSSTGLSMCPGGVSCSVVQTVGAVQIKKCTYPDTTSCTCSDGDVPTSDGRCVIDDPPSSTTPPTTTCPKGEYKIAGECVTCTQGSYCPGDGSINACPSDKPKSNAGSSSVSDCKASGSLACKAGSYKTTGGYCTICPVGSYCPGDNAKHDCPSNTQQGQSTCGETCKAGEYRIAGDCVTCTQGSYCPGDGSIQACPTDKPKSNAGSSSVSDCKASGSDTSYVHCDKGWFYTGDGKTCTKCPSGSWCPGGNFLASSLVRDGGVKCPDDRPYSEPGSYQESDCKASGSGGGNPSNPSSGGSSGNDGNGGNGGAGNGNASGNGSNTNTNPGTATKTPLVIVVIGMIAMGLGTFTYYKSKNNEI